IPPPVGAQVARPHGADSFASGTLSAGQVRAYPPQSAGRLSIVATPDAPRRALVGTPKTRLLGPRRAHPPAIPRAVRRLFRPATADPGGGAGRGRVRAPRTRPAGRAAPHLRGAEPARLCRCRAGRADLCRVIGRLSEKPVPAARARGAQPPGPRVAAMLRGL